MIYHQLFLDSATSISKPVAFLINLSIKSSTVPNIWKNAKVTPIHKSGPLDKPENYRPISILPVLSKILERAVHTQLSNYLESNNLLTDSQFGYRKKRSTKLATALFTDNVIKEIDNGRMVGAVFVDLTKIFDTISHSVLLTNLVTYGIINSKLFWFSHYLFNCNRLVENQFIKSDKIPIYCGDAPGFYPGTTTVYTISERSP